MGLVIRFFSLNMEKYPVFGTECDKKTSISINTALGHGKDVLKINYTIMGTSINRISVFTRSDVI